MKIAQSTLSLSAWHAYSVQTRTALSVRSGTAPHPPNGPRPLDATVLRQAAAVQRARVAAVAAPAPARKSTPPPRTEGSAPAKDPSEGPNLPPRLRLLAQIIQTLTGETVRVFDARDLQGQDAHDVATHSSAARSTPGPALTLDVQQTHTESEHSAVQIQGEVLTADGQRLRFSLDLQMQRQTVQETRLRLGLNGPASPPEAQALQDPLIINFDGDAAALSAQRMAFDLNADGQAQRIPLLQGKRGFLVLDRNRNGQIDDGHELFGARSGDGFAELAALDADGNGWIDDADPAFAQLQVWRPQDGDAQNLSSLRDAGVGALSLGRVASPMTLQDGAQRSLGQTRSTGVFLYESGAVGSLQQVDLAVA
ncbi:MAG: hypothetical protein Fur007_21290 [Rhodoferax sp.]